MELEASFRAAVRSLEKTLSGNIVDGRIVGVANFPSNEVLYLRTLLITSDGRRITFREPNEDTLQNVLRCLRSDPASHDFVCWLAAIGLRKDLEAWGNVVIDDGRPRGTAANKMPPLLRLAASLILDGTFPRPAQSGTPPKFARDILYRILIEHTSADFNLKPTRDPRTWPRRSTCDALIAAHEKLGVTPPSFQALRKVWSNKQLSESIWHYREFEALKAATEQTSDQAV